MEGEPNPSVSGMSDGHESGLLVQMTKEGIPTLKKIKVPVPSLRFPSVENSPLSTAKHTRSERRMAGESFLLTAPPPFSPSHPTPPFPPLPMLKQPILLFCASTHHRRGAYKFSTIILIPTTVPESLAQRTCIAGE